MCIYNILNWSSTNTGNLECIRISLKKAVRIISFKNMPLPFYLSLNMWKLDHNQLPTKLASNFTLNDTSNTYIAQRLIQGNYGLPTPRLDCAK